MTDPTGIAEPRVRKEIALNGGEREEDALPDVWGVVHMACTSTGISPNPHRGSSARYPRLLYRFPRPLQLTAHNCLSRGEALPQQGS
jgi:hypothetical protein